MTGEVTWQYDPGETPKRKHGWSKHEAGFVRHGKVLIGKCPADFPLDQATEALRDGIVDQDPRQRTGFPRRIYNVRGGILYRMVPTRPGMSCHGFPELPAEFERLDEGLRRAIWQRARERGEEEALWHWLRQTW